MQSPKKANIFTLVLIIYSVLASVAISVVILFTNADIEKSQLLIIVIQDLIIILIPVLFYCLFTRTRLSGIIPHERLSLKNMVYILLLTLLMAPIILVISSITTLFYSSYDNNALIFSYIDKLPMLFGIIALGVMPAIFEELAFRGIILSNYKSTGLLTSAFISALFFGLFHMDFYQIPYAVAAGVFFAFLVRYTNSIYASMFSHFLINGSQVIQAKLVLIVNGSEEINRQLELAKNTNEYGTIIMGIFLTLIATPLLVITFKKFMAYNEEHKIDYDLSLAQNINNEFEIPIEKTENNKKGFVDIYFIAYILIAVAMTIITNFIK